MSGFDTRRKAFLAQGQHDAMLEFKILSGRNKKIGMWAAKLFNISPLEAHNFVEKVIASVVKDADDSELIKALLEKAKECGASLTEKELRKQIGYFYQEARMEIVSGRF